jgi:hypothetical protein
MLPERIEQLMQEYTDQYVVVEGDRPELARFRGATGQVKTINMSGRALVQFDANGDAGWYDVELDYLKVVDKPEPKPATKAAPAKKPAPKAETAAAKEPKPSPLELARKEKEEAEAKALSEAQTGEEKPGEAKPEGGADTPTPAAEPPAPGE